MNGPVHSIGGRTRTRHTTIAIHSQVAATASSSGQNCSVGSNPGASRCDGCSHLRRRTRLPRAEVEPQAATSARLNSASENQSIASSAVRFSDDTPKVASTTSAGTAIRNSRSLGAADSSDRSEPRGDDQQRQCDVRTAHEVTPRVDRPERKRPQRPRVPADVAQEPEQTFRRRAGRRSRGSTATRRRSRLGLLWMEQSARQSATARRRRPRAERSACARCTRRSP